MFYRFLGSPGTPVNDFFTYGMLGINNPPPPPGWIMGRENPPWPKVSLLYNALYSFYAEGRWGLEGKCKNG